MNASYNDDALREEMVATCRRMNESGINQGTAGNLSVRNPAGFLVTPTSLPYDLMRPSDLVQMSFDGTYEGARRPSSEWRFHRDILAARSDVDCVLHCHSVYATTLAVHHHEIPSFHYMTAIAGGTTIRCSRYATFGTQALSDAALEALEDRMACLLGQHGQIALGKTLSGALSLAIEVETLSRLYVQARVLGEPPVLSDEEMARVIQQMKNMSYGHAPDLDGVNDTPSAKAASVDSKARLSA
ncbi:fuculose phosphate aldolase [Aureimonas ureilytica]|uniref:Fuculose phosphate aldolase n=1 Tax=Aureimonas ureilytica TaxID=401562 RepID=A0A175RTV2_9HYPH|nr:class II aldolase/adducin family protein [Aureimonas ureilytica]KTR06259.1 fuculose phosphate aldolase [Aureimonas ureilytica]